MLPVQKFTRLLHHFLCLLGIVWSLRVDLRHRLPGFNRALVLSQLQRDKMYVILVIIPTLTTISYTLVAIHDILSVVMCFICHISWKGYRVPPPVARVQSPLHYFYAIPRLKVGIASLVRPVGLEPTLAGLKDQYFSR